MLSSYLTFANYLYLGVWIGTILLFRSTSGKNLMCRYEKGIVSTNDLLYAAVGLFVVTAALWLPLMIVTGVQRITALLHDHWIWHRIKHH